MIHQEFTMGCIILGMLNHFISLLYLAQIRGKPPLDQRLSRISKAWLLTASLSLQLSPPPSFGRCDGDLACHEFTHGMNDVF